MRAALAAVLLLGCNAVLGLDERGRAVDGGDEDTTSSDTSVTVDTNESDTLVSDDAEDPDDSRGPTPDGVTGVDTGPTSTPACTPACAAGQKCYLVWVKAKDGYSTACAESFPFKSSPLGSCFETGMGQYACSDGYACGYLYPGRTACFPLCTSAATCPLEARYCSVRLSETASRCAQCNPIGKSTDCGPTLATRCMVLDSVNPPTCAKYGVKGQGDNCSASSVCGPGFVCDCAAAGGMPRLGSECLETADGRCRQLCSPSVPCPTPLTCLSIAGTNYFGCR